jgi:hypothetical protein
MSLTGQADTEFNWHPMSNTRQALPLKTPLDQGLTLVPISAQVEQLQDAFMS